jgi:tRNA-specific 2-thiouridylase
VVDYFYDEYTAGRTPNPCLRCNRQIRFSRLLAQARQLGADWVATGHYARIEADPVTAARSLRMARDQHKDQSYVLHILTRDQLDHALFPLGDLTKPEVRALAAERGLDVASKAESQEVCFVSGNDYRGFLRRYAGETGRAMPRGGVIMDERGETLGAHDGLAGYTIGQRKGLGISAREPLHVLRLDAARNAVVVGPASALLARSFTVRDTTFHRDETGALPFRGLVKVRYKAEPVACEVSPLPGNRAEVRMAEPLRAVTPGQAAVWYGGATDDVVLGGGIIE